MCDALVRSRGLKGERIVKARPRDRGLRECLEHHFSSKDAWVCRQTLFLKVDLSHASPKNDGRGLGIGLQVAAKFNEATVAIEMRKNVASTDHVELR